MNTKGIIPADLTSEVTVFVTTVGDTVNYRDCIEHLDRQDSQFRFEAIDHVAPMSAAFQAMIDRCETPYYVQVDEDMILYHYAIRLLHDAITKAPEDRAIICYPLWDAHLEQTILGVKIYRHEIVKQFPYRDDVPHCDMDQVGRLKDAGYTVQSVWRGFGKDGLAMGEHGVHYTPATAYEAYFNRAAKSRLFPEWMSWTRKNLAMFWQRLQDDPENTIDLYAMLGFVAGLTTDLDKFNHEKDWRNIRHDFLRLQADIGTADPTELCLHVTSKCNLACQFCPRQKGQVETKPDMTAEIVKLALNKCRSIRSVCIAGFGEPLLCASLQEIVAECKRRRLWVGLITNGVLLDDFALHLRGWGVDSVSVSLNAATTDGHRKANGSETWERVLNGIGLAAKIHPGRVSVSMVCQRDNVADMGPFLDLAAGLGVAAVDFISLLPSETHDNAYFTGQRLSAADAPAIETLKSHEHAGLVRTWPTIPAGPCPGCCKSPYVSVSMDADGLVSPCRRVMRPSKQFGSIHAAVMPWHLPAWYNLRAGIEGDREKHPLCELCFANWADA